MRFGKAAGLGALVVLVVGTGMARQSEAAYIATLSQVGANVVATGSGSFDVTSLTFGGADVARSAINPSNGSISLGPADLTPIVNYFGLVDGPGSFGSGGYAVSSSGGGSFSQFSIGGGFVQTPPGYVSGTSLGTSTAVFDDATFASLGVTAGSYTWTWGSGAHADSYVLDIAAAAPAAVPEPASIALLAPALIGLGIGVRKRRPRDRT